MKIIIDIDENVFTRLFDNGIEDYAIVNDDLFAIAKSIRNCIPIPEEHGDLIDAKEVYKKFYCRCLAGVATEVLNEITPIIKAETRDKEK